MREKSRNVQVRLPVSEDDQLPKTRAHRAAFLRNAIRAALAERRAPTESEMAALREWTRQLTGAANNLNQLTRLFNASVRSEASRGVLMTPPTAKEVKVALDEVRAALAAIREMLAAWE